MFLKKTPYIGCLFTAVLLLSGCVTTDTNHSLMSQQENTAESSQALPMLIEATKIKESIPLDIAQPVSDDKLSLSAEENLWFAIRSGFTWPVPNNKRVAAHQRWFLKNPSYMQRVNQRATPYLYFIKTELENNELPLELALLPIVESAFEPFAYSHGRAAGLWQFVPSTAKSFGMDIDWWYDGRRDVYASTKGAMKFLAYLNKRFNGDWLHALAAYNSGEGRVRQAIKRNKLAGKPTDFWHLDLPKETRDYVPKLLALVDLLQNAEAKSYDWPQIDNQPAVTSVYVDAQIDLSVAAELAGISTQALHQLNPGFNRWATDPAGKYPLFIPIESQAVFSQGIEMLEADQRVQWQRHQVSSGESLGVLATRYQTTKQVIKDVNSLTSDTIVIGQHLMIPKAKKSLDTYTLSQQQRLTKTQNRPRGQTKLSHVVTSGDTLWDLSRLYKVNLSSLAKWNGLAPKDPIKPGMKLVIWKNQSISAKADSIIRKLTYTVRSGDSLSRIASKFKVKISQIVQWNTLDVKRYLKPGQQLKLFVDVTRS